MNTNTINTTNLRGLASRSLSALLGPLALLAAAVFATAAALSPGCTMDTARQVAPDPGHGPALAPVTAAPGEGPKYYAPDGLTHLCERWPSKCVAPAGPDAGEMALGLVCCGNGWCLAVETNSDCGPAGDVYYCEHGQSTTNAQGLPDVECFD